MQIPTNADVHHPANLLLALKTIACGAVVAHDEEQVLAVEWENFTLTFEDGGFGASLWSRNAAGDSTRCPLDPDASATLADLLGQRRLYDENLL